MTKQRHLTVADFMTKNPISVRFDMTLEEVEKIFEHNRLTAVPVLDPFSRILGVITDFMLVKMFLQKTSKKMNGNLLSFIGDLDPILTISEGESMQEAFKLMLRSPNHRVFVVNKTELVGALSPKDLLPFLAGSEKGRKSIQDELIQAQKEILKLSTELDTAKKNLVSYKKFFDDSPFMMHSVDWDGTILMANKMLHFTLGYDSKELLGKSVKDLYSHQNHQEAQEGLEKIRVLGFHPPVSTLMATKHKEVLKVDVASMVRRDENGKMIGTISITRLTDSNNMMAILKQAAHMFELDSSIKNGQQPKKAKA